MIPNEKGLNVMDDRKHVIWSNFDLDIEDCWRDVYAECAEINGWDYDPDDDYAVYEYMVETNSMYLDDERYNLDIEVSQPIIAIADLGLWNGRFSGYKELGGRNIKYRDDVSEEQIEEFLDKIYEGNATQDDIDAVTRSLGDEIAEVYGW